jgi:uncharacterized protein YndB with AHSA1/START domain
MKRSMVHETIVLERDYRTGVDRVFAAFADPQRRVRWDIPEEGWELANLTQDFRVGGREARRFGPKGDPRYSSDGVYLNIELNSRIISAGTMHEHEKPITCTLASLEFYPRASGTRLILTEQSAYFGPETSKQRRGGWSHILDNLTEYLSGREKPE